MPDVRVTVTESGPISIRGPITLLDQDGDGSHTRTGFTAAERAADEPGGAAAA